MSDKGIIFSAPMVRALLEGRKTQTRRLLADAPKEGNWHCDRGAVGLRWVAEGGSPSMPCRVPYAVGERLYVREAFAGPKTYEGLKPTQWPQERPCIRYLADNHRTDPPHPVDEGKGRPSIHMPRWASRLWLLVTEVRVQRVQYLTEADATAEGVERHPAAPGHLWKSYLEDANPAATARLSFSGLWDSLHTEPGARWEDNPWIVAVTFEVRHGNIDNSENLNA